MKWFENFVFKIEVFVLEMSYWDLNFVWLLFVYWIGDKVFFVVVNCSSWLILMILGFNICEIFFVKYKLCVSINWFMGLFVSNEL